MLLRRHLPWRIVVTCSRVNQQRLVIYKMPTRAAVENLVAKISITRVADGEDNLMLSFFVALDLSRSPSCILLGKCEDHATTAATIIRYDSKVSFF